MDQAQAAQSTSACTESPPIREFGSGLGTDHDVLDGARTIEEDADLAANVCGDRREFPGQIVRNDPVFRKPPPSESFERFDLVGLQASGVAMDLDGFAPGG
jgi:hypothetical protein